METLKNFMVYCTLALLAAYFIVAAAIVRRLTIPERFGLFLPVVLFLGFVFLAVRWLDNQK